MVGRERRYLEAGLVFLHVVLYDVYVVGRERRYLEAWVFSASGVLKTNSARLPPPQGCPSQRLSD